MDFIPSGTFKLYEYTNAGEVDVFGTAKYFKITLSHNCIIVHALKVGMLYDTKTAIDNIVLLRLPVKPTISMIPFGITLARIYLPPNIKLSEATMREYIHDLDIPPVSPLSIASSYNTKSFEEIVEIIYFYAHELDCDEANDTIELPSMNIALVESFGDGIIYIDDGNVCKQTFFGQREVLFQCCEDPIALSAHRDSNFIFVSHASRNVVVHDDTGTYTTDATFGLVARDRCVLEYRKVHYLAKGIWSLITASTRLLLSAPVGEFILQNLSAVPWSNMVGFGLEVGVVKHTKDVSKSVFKDCELCEASSNLNTLVLSRVGELTCWKGDEQIDEPRIHDSLPENPNIYRRIVYVKLSSTAPYSELVRVLRHSILCVYSVRGELKYSSNDTLKELGIDLPKDHVDLLNYPGICQIKRYGNKLMIVTNENGRRTVTLRYRVADLAQMNAIVLPLLKEPKFE